MLKFKPGNLYMTRGIDCELKKNKEYFTELLCCLERYLLGDWGNLTEEDKKANDEAIKNNEKILGAYNTSKGKIYVITEWNRTHTTIMFACEY